MFKTTTTLAFLSIAILSTSAAQADTFGSGANTFDIDFVTIGNPGNDDDDTGAPLQAGKVDSTYRIGQFVISEDMIDKANTLGGLGITKDTRGPNKPATNVTWFEAAQFVNWLNTDSSSTPAYKFISNTFELWMPGDAGYNPNNLYRNSGAKYFLPSVDEWYKAAYYDPNKAGGAGYYNYPTGSDSVPDGIDFVGDTAFDAVFWDGSSNSAPNDITDVGVLSPYGTAGQGGNIFEWEETNFNLMNGSGIHARAVRGGGWNRKSNFLLSSRRSLVSPSREIDIVGFRVASTPEPNTLLLGVLASLGLLVRRRRLS